MGILLAFAALLSWGLGDFLIQRSARTFGDWIALFYITAFGAIILLPFVYNDILASFSAHGILLWFAGFVVLFAALLDFEALRIGKISVVEPIYALEIPITAVLATYIIHEQLSLLQIIFIALIAIGIFFVSTPSLRHLKKIHLEKGVWYAILATLGMGVTNFLFGVGARTVNPLMINWFTSVFIAVIALAYIFFTSRQKELFHNFKKHSSLIVNVSLFDNLAWITYAYATLFIPIAVATGISEGYIAFAGVLGLFVNKEKLKTHQFVGFSIVIISIMLLAFITDH